MFRYNWVFLVEKIFPCYEKNVYFCTMIDVEICCNSRASAEAAKEGGASRIELCRNLEVGGLTPADEDIDYCVNTLGLRTHVLIRPREGNFCYTEAELMDINLTIKRCKELGVHAVVMGFLTFDGCIDAEVTRRMVQLAAPMEVTFHRAFDEALQDPVEALWQVASARCDRLLTSGQHFSAELGRDTIRSLVGVTGVKILAGGGVTPYNVRELVEYTGICEVHASCKTTLPDGTLQTDPELVRELLQNVSGL